MVKTLRYEVVVYGSVEVKQVLVKRVCGVIFIFGGVCVFSRFQEVGVRRIVVLGFGVRTLINIWSFFFQNQFSGYLLRKFKNSIGWQKFWVVFINFCLFFYKIYQVGGLIEQRVVVFVVRGQSFLFVGFFFYFGLEEGGFIILGFFRFVGLFEFVVIGRSGE